MSGLGRAMAKGAAWMVLFKLIERSIGLISMIVLARLLVPEDFGLVALAVSMLAVLELLGAFSFDMALIQNPDAGRAHYDTAWTFTVLFGILCAVILVIIAHPVANFYAEPRLPAVMYLLALGSAVRGFENIGIVAFRKDMQFNREFSFLLWKKLLGTVVTITLALVWRNYWALLAGMLTTRVVGVVMSYVVQSYRPRFGLNARHELFHFSKWLLINNLLSFINNRSGDFIIGKLAGVRALGIYNLAYEISNLATTELIAPINRAVFPGYAKMAADPDAMRKGFLDVISLVAIIALPVGTGVAATAALVVPIFLGPNWSEAVPIIQVLAFYGMLTALQTNSGYVYIALGKPHAIALQVLAYVVVLLPLLVWLTMTRGALGAAYAYLISVLVVSPGVFLFLLRSLRLRMSVFLHALLRPTVACLLMFQTVIWLSGILEFNRYFALAASVLTGAAVYSVVVFVLWQFQGRPEGPEAKVLDLLKSRLHAQRQG